MSGRVVAHHSQTPVFASIEAGQSTAYSVQTSSDGKFTINSLSSGLVQLSIGAPGYNTYRSRADLTEKPSDLTIQLIPSSDPFDLTFFRAFARGSQDGPLQPTFNWSVNPSFYLRTVTADSGQPLPVATLDAIEALFRRAVPELSGGLLRVESVARGSAIPIPRQGSVSVQFYAGLIDADPNRGGDATVGGNQGRMRLRYDPALDDGVVNQRRQCESFSVLMADHEIVHIMGYYHTDTTYIDFDSGTGCPGAGRPARVRYHASVMYARPPGNTDIDNDPPSFAYPLSGVGAGQRMIACEFYRLAK